MRLVDEGGERQCATAAIAQATYAFAPWTFGVVRSFDTPMMFGLAAAIQLAAIACLLARR